jgi:hypothetical protein
MWTVVDTGVMSMEMALRVAEALQVSKVLGRCHRAQRWYAAPGHWACTPAAAWTPVAMHIKGSVSGHARVTSEEPPSGIVAPA